MIDFKDLTLRLGTNLIFDNFNLTIESGEKIGVIGGEGSGKTTMLDLIAGRVVPNSGTIEVKGKIVTVSRNIYANFSELKMAEMSTSEKFKMMLFKALDDKNDEEKILLLDEPTKNLDSDEIDWLIDFLNDAKTLTVVVASNDRYFLKKVCDRRLTLGDAKAEKIVLPELNEEDLQNNDDEVILHVENLFKIVDGEPVFKKVSFTMKRGQKIALVGKNELGQSKFMRVLAFGIEFKGAVHFDSSVRLAYMPQVFSSAAAKSELENLRDSNANFLILDHPTSYLDLLTIIELEKALINFKGTLIFSDSDHEFIQAIANRIIDITPDGTVDRISSYDDFLANETVKRQIAEKYKS